MPLSRDTQRKTKKSNFNPTKGLHLSKSEFPPLLTPGFHPMTLDELSIMALDNFPLSSTRADIVDGLSKIVTKISATDLASEIWVDGSFMTEKIDPEDSDIAVRILGLVAGGLTEDQADIFDWITDKDLKPDYLCDSYGFVEYESTHKLSAIGEWSRAYWLKQFGFSRSNKMKGIAVILTP